MRCAVLFLLMYIIAHFASKMLSALFCLHLCIFYLFRRAYINNNVKNKTAEGAICTLRRSFLSKE